ncbi:uncharacterized protein LOC133920158 isoform X3 [Phragmites australis]|nr:uncharacterized protein LOC133920158 isoform X3 [Phragmites australis]XP_062220821.1 uncharacterized protein LOC133920158 isoform X3 [Phragmites australis]XP_062220822.1 uncharacterized protein LOC133920158 isoform X3 [Phragmites australis]XP_062220823.1 uncharacterized protein LOC133920158 isoform X3 [Phragmites australis]XP_062220824.1 uncharacterized protein LOC133920158 isoform X3 [Phragmites australis]XP_062220825.1 uncharacterized protein LOC133920158 isoform X3 [Phragmites australis]
MGCFSSKPNDAGAIRRRPGSIGDVAVFIPGLRVPESLEMSQPLDDGLPRRLTERLAALRSRIVVMAAHEALSVTRPRKRTFTQHGGSTSADLLRALEEYLPVLLELIKEAGSDLEDKIVFSWMNQEDDAEETALPSAWYEVLSILHMMAMLRLSQANSLLLPKTSLEGYHAKVSEDNKRASVEIFLKASGYLECAIQHVLPRLSPENRKGLPVDLAEGVLKAICMQALGQAIDVQLGLAIDSPKATLAVKRRLACEIVKCWQQAHESMADLPLIDSWGEKHRLFLKWKYIEAKAAAYYYHGLILDEGNTEKSHKMAVAALQSAEEFLRESKDVCETFHAAPPVSRSPPVCGSMKYLHEKIQKDSSSKVRINKDLYSNDSIHEAVPALPDFAVALKPEEYRLPLTEDAAND